MLFFPNFLVVAFLRLRSNKSSPKFRCDASKMRLDNGGAFSFHAGLASSIACKSSQPTDCFDGTVKADAKCEILESVLSTDQTSALVSLSSLSGLPNSSSNYIRNFIEFTLPANKCATRSRRERRMRAGSSWSSL